MPLDPKLDLKYFMKNRNRLLKFIKFVKENPGITDSDLQLKSIQKKITIAGLGLRESYTPSAMAYLPNFVSSFGGIDYFRSEPLEMIAGHRAVALYVVLSMNEGQDLPGKCPYYKCSLVSAEKLYRKIFKLSEDDSAQPGNTLAMQHILQSKNYCEDYFDLKENPADSSWNEEKLLTRVQEFVQQQIVSDEKDGKKKESRVESVQNIEDGDTFARPHSSSAATGQEGQSMSPMLSPQSIANDPSETNDQNEEKNYKGTEAVMGNRKIEHATIARDLDVEGVEVQKKGKVSTIPENAPQHKGRKCDVRVSGRVRRAPKRLDL